MNILIRPFALIAEYGYGWAKIALMLGKAAYQTNWHPDGKLQFENIIGALQTIWPQNEDGTYKDISLTPWSKK